MPPPSRGQPGLGTPREAASRGPTSPNPVLLRAPDPAACWHAWEGSRRQPSPGRGGYPGSEPVAGSPCSRRTGSSADRPRQVSAVTGAALCPPFPASQWEHCTLGHVSPGVSSGHPQDVLDKSTVGASCSTERPGHTERPSPTGITRQRWLLGQEPGIAAGPPRTRAVGCRFPSCPSGRQSGRASHSGWQGSCRCPPRCRLPVGVCGPRAGLPQDPAVRAGWAPRSQT